MAFFLGISVSTVTFPSFGKTKKDENKKQELFPYEEKTLNNGLRIMMVHNKELPRIKLHLMLNRGSLWDPPKKTGLSLLTARLLKQGTHSLSYLQLSYAFAQIGSELNVNVGFDSISFSASTLSNYGVTLLKLMKQVLLSPRMDKKDFSREKHKLLQALKTLPDNKNSFATRLFYEELFPSSLLYGRPQKGWQRTLKRIQHEDIVRHYFQHYRPNRFILLVSGKIQDNFIKKIKTAFQSWKKAESWKTAYSPSFPQKDGEDQKNKQSNKHKGNKKDKDSSKASQTSQPSTKAGRRLKIIHQKGLKLSHILLGRQGKPRRYEKDMSLRLATLALGSGMSSRLHVALREKTPLVYSVHAQRVAWKEAGAFIIKTTTANKNTTKALSKILSLFSRWHRQGITSGELKKVKNKYRRAFASGVETSEYMADNLASLYSFGFAKPYQTLESLLEEMESVSPSSIRKSLKEALPSKNLQVLLIGDKDQMDLKKLQKMKWASFEVVPLKEIKL